jgi:cytochrome c551/c552
MRKRLRYAAIALAVLAVVIQLIQPERSNPPADPAASFEAVVSPSPQVAAVLARACNDCHSNRTVWPWYSKVAPLSWLVAHDVNEGRARLNFSEWNRLGAEMSALRMKAICKEAREGEMPPWQYALMHAGAKLSDADAGLLCSAATRTR